MTSEREAGCGFIEYTEGGGLYFRARSLPFPHAFGTKTGKIERGGLVLMRQVHGSECRLVTEAELGKTIDGCDALITDRPGVPIAVKTADCTPILLCDPKKRVIAAVHAGWRGTIKGIAPYVFRRMVDMGCAPENILAAIGAAAGFCCYEVGEDFRLEVEKALGGDICSMFVRPYIGDGEGGVCSMSRRKPLHADIPSLNAYLLCQGGAKRENISVLGRCTICESEIFNSYRATGLKETMRAYIEIPAES